MDLGQGRGVLGEEDKRNKTREAGRGDGWVDAVTPEMYWGPGNHVLGLTAVGLVGVGGAVPANPSPLGSLVSL